MRIGAVVRDGSEVVIPAGGFHIQAGDRIVVLVLYLLRSQR